jgi:hypothetical protein
VYFGVVSLLFLSCGVFVGRGTLLALFPALSFCFACVVLDCGELVLIVDFRKQFTLPVSRGACRGHPPATPRVSTGFTSRASHKNVRHQNSYGQHQPSSPRLRAPRMSVQNLRVYTFSFTRAYGVPTHCKLHCSVLRQSKSTHARVQQRYTNSAACGAGTCCPLGGLL